MTTTTRSSLLRTACHLQYQPSQHVELYGKVRNGASWASTDLPGQYGVGRTCSTTEPTRRGNWSLVEPVPRAAVCALWPRKRPIRRRPRPCQLLQQESPHTAALASPTQLGLGEAHSQRVQALIISPNVLPSSTNHCDPRRPPRR